MPLLGNNKLSIVGTLLLVICGLTGATLLTLIVLGMSADRQYAALSTKADLQNALANVAQQLTTSGNVEAVPIALKDQWEARGIRLQVSRGQTDFVETEMRSGSLVSLHRTLPGQTAAPTYLIASKEVRPELGKATTIALGFGLAFFLIAMAAAIYLGRAIAQPIKKFAAAAKDVRDLDLDSVPTLPPNKLVEIDEANNAFNRMTHGLRWFQSYVPTHLIRTLLAMEQDTNLRTELRPVTILFTDLVGFTSLSEGLSANETLSLLNEHFELVGQCIDQEEGTIDKYLGDGLMAFWGGIEAQHDHASRAIAAAKAMAQAVDHQNRQRWDAGLPRLKLRIGIHTGRAAVGNVGAPGRINFTVVGDAVNTAQRLESLASEWIGEDQDTIILASEQTLESVRRCTNSQAEFGPDEGEFELMGTRQVRGRKAEIAVYRIH